MAIEALLRQRATARFLEQYDTATPLKVLAQIVLDLTFRGKRHGGNCSTRIADESNVLFEHRLTLFEPLRLYR
jgi:hypothetical protein